MDLLIERLFLGFQHCEKEMWCASGRRELLLRIIPIEVAIWDRIPKNEEKAESKANARLKV
jgi:hypothetical protein